MSLDNTSHPGRPGLDELVPSRYWCAAAAGPYSHAICGQLCSPSARSSSMTVCRYMPTSAHWGRPRLERQALP